jgi:hypothetical protein
VAVCAHDHDYRLAAWARHVVGYRIHGAVTRPPPGLTAGLPKSRVRSGPYPTVALRLGPGPPEAHRVPAHEFTSFSFKRRWADTNPKEP